MPKNVIPPDPELAPELQEKYVRFSWAAEHLGVDKSTLHKAVYRGKLRSVQIGPRLYGLLREELESYEMDRPGPKPGQ